MQPTGERMVPESAHIGTFWEHVYRYRFARQFVNGKRVLDIASGEGYGLAALVASGAREGVGVDISEQACQHARSKYGLDVHVGSAEAIPLPDASVDVITSFETIEHVPSPQAFLAECQRVLRPGGRLVISTPINETYGTQNPNEYHVSEMTEAESVDLIGKYFMDLRLWAQRPHTLPSWRADTNAADGSLRAAGKVWRNFCARLAVKSGRSDRLYSTKYWRDHPAEAINASSGGLIPMNPYRVRRRSQFRGVGPEFLIVVATHRAVA